MWCERRCGVVCRETRGVGGMEWDGVEEVWFSREGSFYSWSSELMRFNSRSSIARDRAPGADSGFN
jgi:hypothetical protein